MKHQYFRLVGYAYQSHLLEMPRVVNERLESGFHYANVKNG